MDRLLPECFIIGQFAVRMVMGEILNVSDGDMQECRIRGENFLKKTGVSQDVIKRYGQLLNVRRGKQRKHRERIAKAETRLSIFLHTFAHWLEKTELEENLKAFNLGFCTFLAMFYAKLAGSDSSKFALQVAETAATINRLASELDISADEVKEVHRLLEAAEGERDYTKISNLFLRLFVRALRELNGEHLLDVIHPFPGL